MKPFFILLGLSICVMSLSAQEAYQYNQFYYQRSTLFEKLPIDSDDIVFLGNSITNGCEWHELFNNPNIKNRGISSDVSMGVYDRLDPIIKGKPAKIFLMIGINDIAHHLSTDSIVKNITQIIRKIKKETPSTQLYIQSLLPTNDSFERFKTIVGKTPQIIEINQQLEELAPIEKYTYIDLFPHLTTPVTTVLDPQYTNDGLHLLGDGYLVWKDVLLPYLQ